MLGPAEEGGIRQWLSMADVIEPTMRIAVTSVAGLAEQVRQRIRRQTSDAGLALRMVPEVPNEGLLLSRAALLRDSFGQRLDIQVATGSCLNVPSKQCRLVCSSVSVRCTGYHLLDELMYAC